MKDTNKIKSHYLVALALIATGISWVIVDDAPTPLNSLSNRELSTPDEHEVAEYPFEYDRSVSEIAFPETYLNESDSHELETHSTVTESIKEYDRNWTIGFPEVEKALMKARFDDDGSLILDDQTRMSLDRVVNRLPQLLSETQMAQIQSLIRQGIVGEAGDQVADVLKRYYRFKQAEREWQSNGQVAQSVEAAMIQLNDLMVLRRHHLGDSLTDQLFGHQQRKTAYALEKIRIQQDPRLSSDETKDRLMTLAGSYQDSLYQDSVYQDSNTPLQASVSGISLDSHSEPVGQQLNSMAAQQERWNSRYQIYLQEKQLIVNAAMSDGEKQAQIELLLRDHYSPEELAGARAYDKQQSR